MRWTAVGVGAATFLMAHALEAARWQAWFAPPGAYPPWFLNAGRAAGFTAAALFAAALLVAAAARPARSDAARVGVNIAFGAVLAMIVVLAATGPGTIFPLVLVIGGLLLGASAVAGAFVGAALRPPRP